MDVDDQIGEEERQRPVGTRGGMGWMWGPCACPGWGTDPLESQSPRTTRGASRTGTRPPPFSSSTPCPYRRGADVFWYSLFRLLKFIIGPYGFAVAFAPYRWSLAYKYFITPNASLLLHTSKESDMMSAI